MVFQHFLLALALGALIGLEREYARYKQRGHKYAGIRTFPLISLFGALAAFLSELFTPWLLIVAFAILGVLSALSYFSVADRKHIGATTEIAGLLTFFLGVLSMEGEFILASTLAIIIAVLLYARSLLHHFAEKIKEKELSATLKFAVIALVILPFLPNKGYGPLEVFNPFLTWLMVVFISGISFIGYILLKWYGQQGIALTGFLGGMVSSTAATISLANRSRKEKQLALALALAAVLATGVSFARILVEVFALNRELFVQVLIPLLLLMLLVLFFAWRLWKKASAAGGSATALAARGKMELRTPFALKPAIKFAAIFASVLALAKIADFFLAEKGVYLASILSGVADVDAAALSLSRLAAEGMPLQLARNGIIVAALVNIMVKGGLAWWFGGRLFGRKVLGVFVVLILAGAGMLFLPI